MTRSPSSAQGLGHQMTRDYAVYAPALLIPAVLGAASLLFLARLLPLDELGIYTLTLATASIVSTVSGEWIQQSIMRLYSEAVRDRRVGELLGTSAALLGIASFAAGGFGVLVASVFRSLGTVAVGSAVMLVLGNMWLAFGSSIIRAQNRSRAYAFWALVNSGARFVAPVALAWVTGLARWSLLGYGGTACIVASWVAFRSVRSARSNSAALHFDSGLAREVVRYGLPYLATATGSNVMQSGDRYIVAGWLGVASAGMYTACYQLIEKTVGFVLGALVFASHTLIFGAWTDGRAAELERLLMRLEEVVVFFSLCAFAYIMVFSREITHFLLGSKYLPAHRLMPVVVVAICIWFLAQFVHKDLELHKRTPRIAQYVVVAAVAGMAATAALVPALGLMGSAVGTLLGYSVYLALLSVSAWRRRSRLGLQLRHSMLLRSVGAAAAVAGVTIGVRSIATAAGAPPWLGVCGSLVIAVATAIAASRLTGFLTASDSRQILAVVKSALRKEG